MNTVGRKRRPVLAAIFALLGLGLGHLYSGRIGLAVAWYVVSILAFSIALWTMMTWDIMPMNILLPIAVLLIVFLVHIWHAWLTARRQPEGFSLRGYNRWYYYVLWLAAATLSLPLVVPLNGNFKSYRMPSASMENTISLGEYFIGDLSAYDNTDPIKGDVVVFIFPEDGVTRYVKRCVALPGDTLLIINKELYINDEPADEPPGLIFIDTLADGSQKTQPRQSGYRDSRDNFGPYIVPAGNYFVMGDSRDNSFDSRYWGTVPRELLLGKAVRIYYSSNWNRMGLRIQ